VKPATTRRQLTNRLKPGYLINALIKYIYFEVKTRSKSVRSPGRPAATGRYDAREHLLNAATELFAVQGVAATTFAMIAKRARLTPAMLHYYFKDRDQLLDAVVEERLLRLVSHVWNPVEVGADAAESIRGIVERLLERIEKMPWIPSTWMREVLNEDGLLRERILRHLPHDKVQSVAEAIVAGQKRKSLNLELDPLLTVFSTLGLVMLHVASVKVWTQAFHREPLSRQSIQRHVTGLLLDGLCHVKAEKSANSPKKKQ
jgi:TetR/AcrR family transcriptional regulator